METKVSVKSPSELARRIVALLGERKKTVTFAESCTGGLIAATLVSAPGSSAVFDGSLVTYANRIKRDYLGVSESTLEKDGAVSSSCAEQMAEGARRAMDADYAVAVTGIAGPGGGSPEKPVGLVYIAVAARGEKTEVFRFVFEGGRTAVRRATCRQALCELYCRISKENE